MRGSARGARWGGFPGEPGCDPPVVKFIRDRTTGLPSGFGFIEFSTHDAAAHVLGTLNGQAIGVTVLAVVLHPQRLGWWATRDALC
jgi:hypothetical protein